MKEVKAKMHLRVIEVNFGNTASRMCIYNITPCYCFRRNFLQFKSQYFKNMQAPTLKNCDYLFRLKELIQSIF